MLFAKNRISFLILFFSVFLWRDSEKLLEIAVKAPQGGKSALNGAVKAGFFCVHQQIRGVIQAKGIEITVIGDSHFALEKAGNVFGIVSHGGGKGVQLAVSFEMFFGVNQNPKEQTRFAFHRSVYGLTVKKSADRVHGTLDFVF